MAVEKRKHRENPKGHLFALLFFLSLCIAEIIMIVLMALGNHQLFIPVLAVGTVAGISLLMYLS